MVDQVFLRKDLGLALGGDPVAAGEWAGAVVRAHDVRPGERGVPLRVDVDLAVRGLVLLVDGERRVGRALAVVQAGVPRLGGLLLVDVEVGTGEPVDVRGVPLAEQNRLADAVLDVDHLRLAAVRPERHALVVVAIREPVEGRGGGECRGRHGLAAGAHAELDARLRPEHRGEFLLDPGHRLRLAHQVVHGRRGADVPRRGRRLGQRGAAGVGPLVLLGDRRPARVDPVRYAVQRGVVPGVRGRTRGTKPGDGQTGEAQP